MIFSLFSGSNVNSCPQCRKLTRKGTLIDLYFNVCIENEETTINDVPKLFFEKSFNISGSLAIKFGVRGTLLDGKTAEFQQELILIKKNGSSVICLDLFGTYDVRKFVRVIRDTDIYTFLIFIRLQIKSRKEEINYLQYIK